MTIIQSFTPNQAAVKRREKLLKEAIEKCGKAWLFHRDNYVTRERHQAVMQAIGRKP
jgi:hypothetical protein